MVLPRGEALPSITDTLLTRDGVFASSSRLTTYPSHLFTRVPDRATIGATSTIGELPVV
jgi:hypothetical protein